MASEGKGSVSLWIDDLKGGGAEATRRVGARFYGGLVRLARAKLRAVPRVAADEEDVALSAFDSFCAGVQGGRFPRLDDRDDLWRVLVTIAARKAGHQVRDQFREKRGG